MAKYLRKDYENGYMNDNLAIEYYKKVQEIDVVNNLLIGDFNSKGEYVTSKEILNELIAMPKYITKTFNTNMYLISNAELNGFNQLTFMITVSDGVPKQNMSRASLLLTEDISKCCGIYINTNSVCLKTYEDINDFDFNEKMFANFNIHEQISKKSAKSEIPLNILNRKTALNEQRESFFEKIKKPQKDFLDRRISTFKRFEIGDKILKEYSRRLTELKNKCSINASQYVYHQNELLDMVLEEFDYKKDRSFKKAVEDCFDFYLKNSQNNNLGIANAQASRTKIKEVNNQNLS